MDQAALAPSGDPSWPWPLASRGRPRIFRAYGGPRIDDDSTPFSSEAAARVEYRRPGL